MKRQLILIRHTKSSWSDLGLRDFDRPLKKDRTDDAKEMAKYLKKISLEPDLIICSPALRTKQTIEYFCGSLKYNYNKVEFDARLYESNAYDYLEVIRETDSRVNSLVIVGHNPSLSDLANLLLNKNIGEIPTTGVVWIDYACIDWELYAHTPSKLKYFLTPKTI